MVEKLYLDGVPEHRLRARLCREFGVTVKTARRYLALAKERFAKLPAPAPEAVRARSEAMLLRAFATAKGKIGPTGTPNPDASTMATVAWRLAELHGATAPKKVDLTSNGKSLAEFLSAGFGAGPGPTTP